MKLVSCKTLPRISDDLGMQKVCKTSPMVEVSLVPSVILAGFRPPNGWEAYEQEISDIGTDNNFGHNCTILVLLPTIGGLAQGGGTQKFVRV